jgi:hypothetical protein
METRKRSAAAGLLRLVCAGAAVHSSSVATAGESTGNSITLVERAVCMMLSELSAGGGDELMMSLNRDVAESAGGAAAGKSITLVEKGVCMMLSELSAGVDPMMSSNRDAQGRVVDKRNHIFDHSSR